jgi:hypothetical protein
MGRIGMKICCQVMGYRRAHEACKQEDNFSKFDDLKIIRRSERSAAKISIIVDGCMKLKNRLKL